MRTQVTFRSDDFPPYPGEEDSINPGIWGKRLAEFLSAELPRRSVIVREFFLEGWGREIPVENEAFAMFLGCGNQIEPGENRYLCFIEPSKPMVRQGLFKKVSTVLDVERVANALDAALRSRDDLHEIEWE